MVNGQVSISGISKGIISSIYSFIRERLSPPQIIILGFLSLIILGTALLSLPFSTASGVRMSFINALFTATSGVCVTGLIVVDTATYFTFWESGNSTFNSGWWIRDNDLNYSFCYSFR